MTKPILSILLLLLSLTAFSQKEFVFNKEGIEYAKNGRFQIAFESFNNAIKANPNFSNAYTNRGNIYRMQKKYGLAIKDYSKSLELNPQNMDVVYSRAKTYCEKKDFQNAIKDYSIIIDQNPSFKDIYFERAYANIRLENYSAAKIDLESQLALTPTDFKSLANVINVKTKLKLFEEALADYETILTAYPDQPNLHIVYSNRANLFKDMDQLPKALENIETALTLNNDYDIGFLNRAEINLKLGNKEQACADFNVALNLGVEKNEHFKVDEDYTLLKKNCK
ncbi:MAG: tetratricopeptide repeat protein [Aequorivita sp.]|nr:tetratricopeptide repeat protein [Aequorivita sp.]